MTTNATHDTNLASSGQAPTGHSASEEVRRVRQELEERLSQLRPSMPHWIRLALNEAEALAWSTPFPHLIFLTLAEEKIRALRTWERRQQALRDREGPILALAA